MFASNSEHVSEGRRGFLVIASVELLGVHLLEAKVFFLQLLQDFHHRGIHAAELGTPFINFGRTHGMRLLPPYPDMPFWFTL